MFTHNCRMILSAFYDGTLKTFDYSQNVTSSVRIHDAPILSTCLLPNQKKDTFTVATASHDLTGRITKVRLIEGEESQVDFVSSLHLHTGPVSSICANSSATQLLTSSWDCTIGIWDTTVPEKDEVPSVQTSSDGSRKRRKTEGSAQGKRKGPIGVLKSHTARVSQVVWKDGDNAVSCGFDSTVRTWDVERGISTETIVSSAFSDCFQSYSLIPYSSQLLKSRFCLYML